MQAIENTTQNSDFKINMENPVWMSPNEVNLIRKFHGSAFTKEDEGVLNEHIIRNKALRNLLRTKPSIPSQEKIIPIAEKIIREIAPILFQSEKLGEATEQTPNFDPTATIDSDIEASAFVFDETSMSGDQTVAHEPQKSEENEKGEIPFDTKVFVATYIYKIISQILFKLGLQKTHRFEKLNFVNLKSNTFATVEIKMGVSKGGFPVGDFEIISYFNGSLVEVELASSIEEAETLQGKLLQKLAVSIEDGTIRNKVTSDLPMVRSRDSSIN